MITEPMTALIDYVKRMKMNTVAQEWAVYFKVVYPFGAKPEQLLQVRRAFYAGWTSALSLVHEASFGTEEEGMAKLEGFAKELKDFNSRAGEGEV